MSGKQYVISSKYLPCRPPITLTALAYLLMDKFGSSPLWQGVIYCLLAIIWLAMIYGMATQKYMKPVMERDE